MSKERGIIFNSEMVRAIQAGRKNQTQRVITKYNTDIDGHGRRVPYGCVWSDFDFDDAFVDPGPSPAGNEGPYLKVALPSQQTRHRLYPEWQVGDRLYVRETYVTQVGEAGYCRGRYKADAEWFTAPEKGLRHPTKKLGFVTIPTIHMPKWAARIWLEITGVRVERVQDINEEDAIAEGLDTEGACLCKEFDGVRYCIHCNKRLWDFVGEFRGIWDSINAKRGYGWEVHPWAWVIEFKELVKDARETNI